MIDPSSVTKDMPVIGSDGETLGQVDGVEGGDRIKLKRSGSPDGQHHYVPMGDVARVDEHVHLSKPAREVRDGWLIAGGADVGVAAGVASPGIATGAARAVEVGEDTHKSWLPWILGSLALLALLVFGLRSCDNAESARSVDTALVAQTGPAVPVAEEMIMLPGGGAIALAPQTIGYDLQQYLASSAAAPRKFEFERLNFDTGRADIRVIDRATVDGLAKILVAYPAAKVRLVGYADARGDARANAALGENRAKAVAAALVAAGVAADRVTTATGGELDETDTNTTAQGQAENRRTELVVLAK